MIRILLTIFSLVLLPTFVFSQEQIKKIQIVGEKRVDEAALQRIIRTVPGPLNSEEVTKDIKRLYNTGYFDQVTAITEDDKNEKSLIFKVVEKPVVRKIFTVGNEEVSESDLAAVIKLDDRRFLDKGLISILIRDAEKLYQSQGYFDASIDYSIVPVDQGQVDLTFNVDEGKRYKIAEIKVQGLNKLDEDEVLSEIETKRYKWWSSWIFGTGRLDQDVLKSDIQLVRQYFLDNGYLDGAVSEPIIEKIKGKKLRLTIPIIEGKRYKIRTVTASGNLIEDDEDKTLSGIKTEKKAFFSASTLREDTFIISEKFSDIGYAFVNVIPKTDVDKKKRTVDIDFEVDKGEIISVNKINIKGNDKTYDNVIRREMKLDEQDTFSSSKLRKSQERLRRLGFFEDVSISPQPTDNPQEVDLDVSVREASTGAVSAGAGYSTSDGALFTTTLSENNILGTGRRAAINLDIGSERESKIISFDDPRLNDSKWSFGVDLQDAEREFNDFDRTLTGGAFSFGYPLEEFFGEWSEDMLFGIRYEYSEIDINNIDLADAAPLVIASEGKSSASGITPRLFRNKIDNPLDPTDGSQQEASVELTGLGGGEDFYLIQLRNQWYEPLIDTGKGKIVFSWRVRFGLGKSYDSEPLPLFRRFFPRGINSVRGFDSRSLGPKDIDNNEFGGNKQLVNNWEIIFPLSQTSGFKGVVFYDVGEAFDDSEQINISDLRHAYGFGIRWSSPLGPIRVEFGFPVDRESGEDAMVTQFSFGAPL